MLLLALACAPVEIDDAGDPSELAAFDMDGDAFWSDLADAGYDVVPGHYNVLMDGAAVEAPLRLQGIRDWAPDLAVEKTFDHVPAFTIEATYAQALELASHPDVLAVEPDHLAFAVGKPTSGCATSSAQTTPAGITAIGSNSATGTGVNVAIIDTGIQTDHPDLTVLGGVGYTSSSGTYADDNGHGSHVAGTVAALNNSQGVIGVAPGANLYAVKVLDRRGSGSYSNITSGVNWAITNADVANMSLGGSYDDSTLHAAITAAKAADLVIVVAAGNEGTSATRSYPAAYDGEVLTVSAYGVSTGTFPSWSNYGVPPIDLAAPGVGVCSTYKGSSYQTLDGTSMASPHVAGAVAIYLQKYPGSSYSTVEAAVMAGVTALTNTSTHSEDLLNISGY